jgi:transcription elongation GreA/GreB family factor
MAEILVKRKIWEQCFNLQASTVDAARKTMLQAEESANSEIGSSEESFDSFREQCQKEREMYSKKLEEASFGLEILRRMDPDYTSEAVAMGAVVKTAIQTFFISISLGEVNVNGEKAYAVSTQSPIYKAMEGKRKGETFKFRDQDVLITDLY